MANEFKIKNGLVVSGSADIEQDLTVRGTITADQLNISIVSSSVMYESGSTKFGDSIDDNHSFTGSIDITGSINLNGQAIGTGKLDETTFNSFTSSYNTVSGSINTRLEDLESFSSSLDGNFITEGEFGTHTSSMNSFTSSTLMTISALNTESSSIRGDFNLFTSSYTNVSTSIDSRLDTLETLSGSFTGSFSGDGTNLYNIPASGVTGLNLTQIADGSVTASVSNINGLRVNSKTEITGSLIVTEGITGSIDYSNITNKPTLVSGSAQIDVTGTTGYSTFSSSISDSVNSVSSSLGDISQSIATTDLNQNNRLDSLETASGSIRTDFNSFTSSYTTVSGSIDSRLDVLEEYSGSQLVPSASMSFRTLQTDVYCKNVTGTQINKGTVVRIVGSVGDNPLIAIADPTTEHTSANVLGVTTVDIPNDSFGMVITEGIFIGIDTDEMTAGDLLYLGVNGTITTTPTVAPNHGVRLGEVLRVQQNNGSIYVRIDNGIELNEAHDVIYNDISSGDLLIRSGSVWKNSKQLTGSYTLTGSLNVTGGLTGSIDYSNITNKPTLVSGSVQVNLPDVTGYSTFSSSVSTSIGDLSSSIATTDNTQDGRISSLETASGSIRTDFNTYTGSNDTTNSTQNNRLNLLEGVTGSYATTGSNTFVGSQTISGSVIIRENLTVLGSSSITYTTSSQLRVDDNVITVNTSNPAERFGGLQVYDSGSVGEATGSLFWDSQKNRWVYQNSSEASYGGGVLLSGPRSSGSLGDELTLTSGKIARSAGGDHLNDSIITEYGGTTIGISGSLEITGSIVSTVTPLVSGSGQISFNGITDKPTLVSGSSQISFNTITDKPTLVSGSSQISFNTIADKPTLISGSSQVLNGSGVWSGSAQLPSGVVSGSSQVLSGTGIWSGSAQLPSGVVSGSGQVSFNGITDKPTLVSGSSQIIFGSITGVPSGLVSGSSQVLAGTTIHSGSFFNGITVVSGSSQISFNGITDKPSGLVSGSSQISYGSITGVPSGIVSGSAQISFGSITGVPSGLVSGSSQISLTSGQVTSGLGFTPYNATNPSGYISGISFANVSSKPTTISGYGITDAITTSNIGSQSVSFATSASSATSATTATFATNSSKLYSTDSSYSYTSGAPYYGYLTYDGTYWQFKVSPATPDQVRVYTADRLGGYAPNQTGTANTIVQRDSNGYIQNNYFYTSGGGAERNGSGISYFAGFNSSDYYIRSYTVGAVQAALGLGTAAFQSANQSLNTSSDPTFSNVYVNDWFRNNATNEGLYNQANGNHFYSTSGSDWVVTGAGGGVALQFRSNHQTTVRGYVHGDTSSNFGLLDNTGNWQVRCNPGNAGGQLYNAWTISGNFVPTSNNSFNLGSTTFGWANIYTNDLHLSNMNKPEGNEIDGTNGTWTIQEGAENLYIINNRNNKKFKITLEEII